ncbi:Exocyst complex component 1 [Fasciola hepatica]|uniref:Exocyst complex component 1 n=1 Tax=Fasciola hepatica TaxID=6192 RepID=A0A4E0RJX8_FASHE|nr:Exocyst complex component 1 [Fasciola hepatica]
MLGIQDQISKLFYPVNERVGVLLEVTPNHHKKTKSKYLVLIVSITKPVCIKFHVIKVPFKGEMQNIPICTTNDLRKFDCRDSKLQPSYELQLTTDYKAWSFTSTKLDTKAEFVRGFCRIVASLQPHVFKEIHLINLPATVDLAAIDLNQSLEVLLNPKSGDTNSNDTNAANEKVRNLTGATDTYCPLTAREEEDIRLFLDELDTESVQRSAAELTEILSTQLADVEGANIHSIMASESQVLQLMAAIDVAITHAERLEQQMDGYHQFLADVEEAMSSLQDSDQLVQVTVDNRERLMSVLNNLVSRLTLDAKSVRSLMDVDLDSPQKIIQCTEAARNLDALLNAPTIEGEQHLRAVEERMGELQRLRDNFASKLAKQVNDTVLRFAMQLSFVMHTHSSSPGDNVSERGSQISLSQAFSVPGVRSASELYKVQRNELLQLAPLVGNWLQNNRRDIYTELKRTYVDKMQVFFRRQIAEILASGRQSINGLTKSNKNSGPMSRVLEAAVESASLISIHNPEGTVLVQIASLMGDMLEKIRSIVIVEENFLKQFFIVPIKLPTTKAILPNGELGSLPECMHTLFSSTENDALGFINDCEQTQPLLVMPMLVAFSRALEAELSHSGMESTDKLSRENAPFMVFLLTQLTMVAKRAFNRYVERLINGFAEGRPSKRSRCGIIRIVHTYVEFAESSIVVFSQSPRLADLERAHGELIRSLMTHLERVASQSVKTPREVVQLENYHRLCDIVRRLKMPALDDYQQEVKRRYNRALQEYTKNSMGRPLEKLATFFEGVQTALDAGVRPEVVQYQFAFSKQELRKVIKEYPGKEVKRGLESLCKKVDKHLSEECNLFQVVWRSIQNEFLDQCGRFNVLIEQCYPDSGITLEFTQTDLEHYFREIAPSR